MSCYYTKQFDGGDQPPAQTKHMAPIAEVNPKLLAAALEQVQRMSEAPMSNTDSVTITIESRPQGKVMMNVTDPQVQNMDMMGALLMEEQQKAAIAERAGSILRNELGVSPTGQYDFRYSTAANPVRKMMR